MDQPVYLWHSEDFESQRPAGAGRLAFKTLDGEIVGVTFVTPTSENPTKMKDAVCLGQGFAHVVNGQQVFV
jgi:hypothetical protein